MKSKNNLLEINFKELKLSIFILFLTSSLSWIVFIFNPTKQIYLIEENSFLEISTAMIFLISGIIFLFNLITHRFFFKLNILGILISFIAFSEETNFLYTLTKGVSFFGKNLPTKFTRVLDNIYYFAVADNMNLFITIFFIILILYIFLKDLRKSFRPFPIFVERRFLSLVIFSFSIFFLSKLLDMRTEFKYINKDLNTLLEEILELNFSITNLLIAIDIFRFKNLFKNFSSK